MKYLIIFIVVILIAAGGYFFLAKNYKSTSSDTAPETANCTTGVNGNNGDNFCSNYHGVSSKCTPHFDNTYPDGCSK